MSRSRTIAWGVALFALFVAALALRLPGLDARPFHADEAVHAIKFQELYQHGRYEYDPDEFHGPTLYYLTLPITALTGLHPFNDVPIRSYRAVTAIWGALLLLLAGLAVGGRRPGSWLLAAALLAFSPSLVYYSRYYIQEMLLAAFTVGYLGCLWRGASTRQGGWLIGAGAFAGLMLASKETAVVAFAAAVPALALGLWTLPRPTEAPRRAPWRDAGIGLLVAVLLGGLLLSGAGTSPKAPLQLARSVVTWGKRAGNAADHAHPFGYYAKLIVRAQQALPPKSAGGVTLLNRRNNGPVSTEVFTVLLALLAVVLLWRDAWLRFLALYTLLLALAYSVTPYKTPWCMIQIATPLALLGGAGGAELVARLPRTWLKALAVLVLALGCAHLGKEAWTYCHYRWVDGRNPYAYSPTAPDAEEIEKEVAALAKVSPKGTETIVQVIARPKESYWPLPWYLRRMAHIGWYNGVPENAIAPIILVDYKLSSEVEDQVAKTHTEGDTYGLRRGSNYTLWVRNDLWAALLASRTGPRIGE